MRSLRRGARRAPSAPPDLFEHSEHVAAEDEHPALASTAKEVTPPPRSFSSGRATRASPAMRTAVSMAWKRPRRRARRAPWRRRRGTALSHPRAPFEPDKGERDAGDRG